MTTLEEHVARAIWKARHERKPYELASARERSDVAYEARAAIAAVHEHGMTLALNEPDPAPHILRDMSESDEADEDWLASHALEGDDVTALRNKPPPDPAEAMRARCEDVIEEQIKLLRQNGKYGYGDLLTVRDKIAALKGKGAGE